MCGSQKCFYFLSEWKTFAIISSTQIRWYFEKKRIRQNQILWSFDEPSRCCLHFPSAWQGAYQKLDWKYKGSTIFEEIQVVSYNFNGLYFYVLLFFMFL